MAEKKSKKPTQRIRITLKAFDHTIIDKAVKMIIDTAERSGAIIAGPIPLPTKRLKVTTRKSPCGDGTATFDRYEMRIHKRIVDLPANDKILHSIMRISVPRTVKIKIEMID